MWSVGPFWRFFLPMIVLLDVVLRGFALWRAARAKQPWWFIALLVINSMGILPAVYLFVINKSQDSCQCDENCDCDCDCSTEATTQLAAKTTNKKPTTRKAASKKK